jgi:GMP synthase (glutamine-hydrolysing)
MKHVLAIRHVAFEDLGTFEKVFVEAGYQVDYVEAPTHDLGALDIHAPDVVVVLGGPIGAYEEDNYPFLLQELKLIEQRLKSGRPLLGICLGAQLMARASGARVYAGPQKEIGWGRLTLTEAGARSALAPLSGDASVLHWHGDTFDLPPSAERLASSPLYENQAFSIGPSVLGLQFHLEASASEIERWLVGHACELSHAGVKLQSLRDGVPTLPSSFYADILRAWLGQLEAVDVSEPSVQRVTV